MFGGYRLLAILGALLAAIAGAFFQGQRAGRSGERVKRLEDENKRWTESDELLRKAKEARRDDRRNSDDGGLLDDDGYKRSGD